MWSNLLSGAIGSILGSILGVIGAYYLAVRTLYKTRENDRSLIREQASVDSAAKLAASFITFHDGLNELMWNAGGLAADASVEIGSQAAEFIWPAMADLSREVAIYETMLPRELSAKVVEVRAAMREIFGVTAKPSVTKAHLKELRERIRAAMDDLSEYCRNAYVE